MMIDGASHHQHISSLIQGVLTLTQVAKGERLLDQIHQILARGDSESQLDESRLEALSEQFYTVIPHKIGRSAAAMRAAIIKSECCSVVLRFVWSERVCRVCVDTAPTQLEAKQELVQLMRDLVNVGSALGGGASSELARVDQRYAALRCDINDVTNQAEVCVVRGEANIMCRFLSCL